MLSGKYTYLLAKQENFFQSSGPRAFVPNAAKRFVFHANMRKLSFIHFPPQRVPSPRQRIKMITFPLLSARRPAARAFFVWIACAAACFALALKPSAAFAQDSAAVSLPYDTLIYRGNKRFNRIEFREAIDFYTKAIKKDAGKFDGWRNRAIAYVELDKYDEALADLDKTLELKPRDTLAHYFKGVVFRETNRRDDAVEWFEKTLELDSTDADAWNDLGLIYYKEEKLLKARDHYTKALSFNPNLVTALINRGIVRTELLDLEAAIRDFDKALELAPNVGVAIANRGVAKINNGMKTEGCADLQKAIDLGYFKAEEVYDRLCKY